MGHKAVNNHQTHALKTRMCLQFSKLDFPCEFWQNEKHPIRTFYGFCGCHWDQTFESRHSAVSPGRRQFSEDSIPVTDSTKPVTNPSVRWCFSEITISNCFFGVCRVPKTTRVLEFTEIHDRYMYCIIWSFPKSWGCPQIIQVIRPWLSIETTMVTWGSKPFSEPPPISPYLPLFTIINHY